MVTQEEIDAFADATATTNGSPPSTGEPRGCSAPFRLPDHRRRSLYMLGLGPRFT